MARRIGSSSRSRYGWATQAVAPAAERLGRRGPSPSPMPTTTGIVVRAESARVSAAPSTVGSDAAASTASGCSAPATSSASAPSAQTIAVTWCSASSSASRSADDSVGVGDEQAGQRLRPYQTPVVLARLRHPRWQYRGHRAYPKRPVM